MDFLTDIEIAQNCKMKPITEIAQKAGIAPKYLEQYGNYKAKIDLSLMKETKKEDKESIEIAQVKAKDAALAFINTPFDKVMSLYNGVKK